MNAGQKVWKGNTYSTVESLSGYYYMTEAVATGMELDGQPMVRYHDLLMPASNGWHATEAAAKQAVVDELIRVAGKLQAAIDTLKDEILHEHLIAEEAAA
jgi:hypothetical protein